VAGKTDSDTVTAPIRQEQRDESVADLIKHRLGITEDQSNLVGLAFILPNMLVFISFMLIPVAFAVFLSFNEWSILAQEPNWVGLANYREAFTPLPWENNWEPLRRPTVNTWWFALKNTFVYTVAVVPTQIYGGLTVALLLDTRIRGKKWFRAVYFLPVMIPGAVAGVMWRWHFSLPGVLNQILAPMGLDHNWAGDPGTALFALIAIGVWIGIGFNMILFLAGLQNIPEELYEAARIDGASQWHRFREVTWPNLANTTFFVIIMAIIFSFQVFGIAWVFNRGGPNYATTTAVVRIYQKAFQQGEMGLASAMSMILFVVLFVFSYWQYKLRRSEEVSY
jgi:ABC-type sugar transport system permease subunit